jgi:hypothetical protein
VALGPVITPPSGSTLPELPPLDDDVVPLDPPLPLLLEPPLPLDDGWLPLLLAFSPPPSVCSPAPGPSATSPLHATPKTPATIKHAAPRSFP